MKSIFVLAFSLVVFQVIGINLNSKTIEFKHINYKYGTYRIEFDIAGIRNDSQAYRIISILKKRKGIKNCEIENLTHCLIISSEIISPKSVRNILKTENVDFDSKTVRINKKSLLKRRNTKINVSPQEEKTFFSTHTFEKQEIYIKQINQLNTRWRDGYR